VIARLLPVIVGAIVACRYDLPETPAVDIQTADRDLHDDVREPDAPRPPKKGWVKRLGGAGDEVVSAIALGKDGDIYVGGGFEMTASFGGANLTSAGKEDVVLARYGPEGEHLWSKRLGGSGVEHLRALALDGSGNIITTGTFEGAADFGGGSLVSAGDRDIFIAKYAPSGKYMWSKRFGGSLPDEGHGVAVDASGNIHAVGCFESTVSLGGQELTSVGGDDVFVAKFDGSGKHLWSRSFGSKKTDNAGDVAVDSKGAVVITGAMYGEVDFGGGTLWGLGQTDIFVAKLTAAGKHEWSKLYGSPEMDDGQAVAVDGADNVILAASFQLTADIGGKKLTSAGKRDVLLAMLTPAGGLVWSKRIGGTGDDAPWDVAAGAGTVVLAGDFDGQVDFGGGRLTSSGESDMFIASYSAAGKHRWSEGAGGSWLDWTAGVAVDKKGNVAAVGAFRGAMDLAGERLTSAGGYDAFLHGRPLTDQ
jgi:uncharacterized protein (AIM24 family)